MTTARASMTGWEHVDEECGRRAVDDLEFLGRRWSGAVLLALARGATRFSQILVLVDGLSDRMLAVRLKELVQAGLVDRQVEPTIPVSVRYRLSDRGRDLLTALQPLAAYGNRWAGDRR